jgi:hypothetical protein
VIIGIFILAGVVTPPDPITQTLVAVPLCGLYELGILGAFAAEGKKRDPIRWRKAWGKLKWVVAALVLLITFRGRIVDAYRAMDADAKVEARSARTAVPWLSVARNVLHAEPEGGYRVRETTGETWIAVAGGGRAALLRFRASTEPSLAVRTDSRSFQILSAPAGAVLWHCDLPTDARTEEVVAPLVAALETGGDETRAMARRILVATTSLPLDVDDRKAAEAVRAWIVPRADAPFPQPPL